MTSDKPRVDARPQTSTGAANPADTAGRAEVRADEIVPDDKDWTWVLERPCPECGLDLPSVEAVDVSAMIRENVDAWRLVLTDASTDLEAAVKRNGFGVLHIHDIGTRIGIPTIRKSLRGTQVRRRARSPPIWSKLVWRWPIDLVRSTAPNGIVGVAEATAPISPLHRSPNTSFTTRYITSTMSDIRVGEIAQHW